MPRFKTEVVHNLGQEEALARVRIMEEYARRSSDLKGEWRNNSFEFSVSVQGVKLHGILSVEAEALKFDGRLPLLAMPFKSWLPRALKKGLQQASSIEFTSTTVGTDDHHGITNSEGPLVLFLHIPKAGGNTLGEYVYNQCRTPHSFNDGQLDSGVAYLSYGFIKEPEPTVPDYVVQLLGRRDLRAVIGHFSFGLHEYVSRPAVYVTLLRDPVERVVSLYYFAKVSEKMTLEEFAQTPPFLEVDNDQTRRIAGVNPPLGRCTRSHLELARENLRQHFQVVGITERMDETLIQLKLKLGLERDVVSISRNVNTSRPKSGSLSSESMNALRDRNELDWELWSYASELLDEAVALGGERFQHELERHRAFNAKGGIDVEPLL